jgi:hypothetical protein
LAVFLRNAAESDDGEKFVDFMLTISGEKRSAPDPAVQLYGDSLTRFSTDCPNTVVAADSQPKSEIQVITPNCLRISPEFAPRYAFERCCRYCGSLRRPETAVWRSRGPLWFPKGSGTGRRDP